MKKSTKIIATVIAVTLVITAMLVAIYAATAGNANISKPRVLGKGNWRR